TFFLVVRMSTFFLWHMGSAVCGCGFKLKRPDGLLIPHLLIAISKLCFIGLFAQRLSTIQFKPISIYFDNPHILTVEFVSFKFQWPSKN
ncbi:hypothetical protein DFH28DRAFT_965943, partial [Melampsora americana]